MPFVASAYLRGTLGMPSIIIWFLDSTGATVGSAQQSGFAMPAQFERKSTVPRIVPPNAAFARVYFRVQSTAASQAIQMDVTNVQFEQGTTATEYQFTGADLDAGRNPTADPNEHFLDEIWFIERKVSETKEVVEFELTTAIDLNGEQLPGRQIISGVCGWLIRGGYRGPFCGYTGPAVADANDVPTTDPSRDQCSGLVRGCKLRFGADSPIPYGGFPAAGLLRT
ncbi:phage minor tail protein L [Stenotrophomonas sp. MH181796]|nr:phage minor tail protein L [Stenotrophomonas sp. MH181796]